jgi:hypothetical protein
VLSRFIWAPVADSHGPCSLLQTAQTRLCPPFFPRPGIPGREASYIHNTINQLTFTITVFFVACPAAASALAEVDILRNRRATAFESRGRSAMRVASRPDLPAAAAQ